MKIFTKFKQLNREIKIIIITALIASCIGVYATGECIISATADDVTYNNTTVQAAIDELFSMSSNYCPPGYECYIPPQSFATDSWDTIIYAVRHNNTSKYNIGDTKTINMENYGNNQIRIVNKDMPEECESDSFSQTACGFVLEFTNVLMNNYMNFTATNVGGWPSSYMRSTLNNEIYNDLPADLKVGIIDTMVISGHGSTQGETNFVSYDKLYLPISREISQNNYNYDTAFNYSRLLDYYTNSSSSNDLYCNRGESDFGMWFRSAYSAASSDFCMNCSYFGHDATDPRGISPMFRIG